MDLNLIQGSIRQIIKAVGEDHNREGLRETPERVAKAYQELLSGYSQDPKEIFKVFEDGVCDEMVLLRNIEFCSMCEHHMLPFLGEAHIAYIPKKRIVGISKLVRLLEIYARRFQVQERLTSQITQAMDKYLQPLGSACIIHAKHLCISCRGVNKQNSVMVTSSLTGGFREPAARMELFTLIRG